MKKYRHIYMIRFSDRVCYSTRLRDIFRFLSRRLLAQDCERGFYNISIEIVRYE